MRYKCADLESFQLQSCRPPDMDSPQRRFRRTQL